MFPTLSFPAISPKIKNLDGKLYIFDIIRRKYVFLTPEEWVRQHVLNYLIEHRNYPKSLLSIESGLRYHQRQKRSDIQAFDRNGNAFLLIECKATTIALTPATWEQATLYNAVVKAPYLAITNGLQLYCWQMDWQTGEMKLLEELKVFEE